MDRVWNDFIEWISCFFKSVPTWFWLFRMLGAFILILLVYLSQKFCTRCGWSDKYKYFAVRALGVSHQGSLPEHHVQNFYRASVTQTWLIAHVDTLFSSRFRSQADTPWPNGCTINYVVRQPRTQVNTLINRTFQGPKYHSQEPG